MACTGCLDVPFKYFTKECSNNIKNTDLFLFLNVLHCLYDEILTINLLLLQLSKPIFSSEIQP